MDHWFETEIRMRRSTLHREAERMRTARACIQRRSLRAGIADVLQLGSDGLAFIASLIDPQHRPA